MTKASKSNRISAASAWRAGAIALLAFVLVLPEPTPAEAQRRPGLTGGRDGGDWHLFRRGKRRVGVRSRRSRRNRGSRRGTAARTTEPRAVIKPKNPRALRATVVGGTLAGQLAQGLTTAFAEEPMLVIVNGAKNGTGLIAGGRRNWSTEIEKTVAEGTTDIFVVLIGAADRRQLREGRRRFRVGTEQWQTLYKQRIAAFTQAMAQAEKPILWVSLPPINSRSGRQHMVRFNGFYKDAAERAGGTFVDIWDRFLSESGRYTSFGPDLTGRRRRLRSSNGIGFTRAGARKLAFYLQSHLNRAIRDGEAALFAEVGDDNLKDGAKQIRVAISLTDPLAQTGEKLLGGTTKAEKVKRLDENSLAYRLFVLGDKIAPHPGRADDFSWPRRTTIRPSGVSGLPGESDPRAAGGPR